MSEPAFASTHTPVPRMPAAPATGRRRRKPAAPPDGRSAMLTASIERIAAVRRASPDGQWRIRLPGKRRTVDIALTEDWLTLALPLRRLGRPAGLNTIDDLLRRNARTDCFVRIVAQRRAGGRQIVADFPADVLPWEDQPGLDALLGQVLDDLDAAACRDSSRIDCSAVAETSREQIEAYLDDAGWPAQPGEGGRLEVPLDVHGDYFAAGIDHDSGLTRLSVPFCPVEFAGASPVCRDAMCVLLWLTASFLRMVRPGKSRGGLALEVSLLAGHSNSIGLAHACAALSVALQRCAAEAALLAKDEDLARAYLANLGFPTSP